MTTLGLLPNALSLLRLAIALLLPAVYWLAPRPSADWITFALFSLAMITDFLDGWLARRFSLQSEFGRMLDPIADKAAVLVALILWAALWQKDHPGALDPRAFAPVTLILLRELIVSGLREHLGGGAGLAVSKLAKLKTVLQSIALGALFLDQALRQGGSESLTSAALALLWGATALTIWTGTEYARAAWREMRARR
ncbi:MAG: CDP-diacylglycerol--glycerol-3-phosphate 3-phosphatidyltransferase [Neomegalonema sp.]|nr:CDP-diacylglycerol--glycerol-3-phosphate 3-phosphatidyltransferase [Neomegalonema sp.]